jgi:hypothetical protein
MTVELMLPGGSRREGSSVKLDGPIVQLLDKKQEFMFAYHLVPGEYVVRTQKDGKNFYEVIR